METTRKSTYNREKVYEIHCHYIVCRTMDVKYRISAYGAENELNIWGVVQKIC